MGFIYPNKTVSKVTSISSKSYYAKHPLIFDMIDLFDRVYFLKASQELLAERLRHESRENQMGRTDYQLQNAINWAKEIEEKANQSGVIMIDAGKSPEEVFAEISK